MMVEHTFDCAVHNAPAYPPAPCDCGAFERLKAIHAELMILLQEALPHVEKMANVLATGPVAGPVEHLADDIQVALAKAKGAAA